MDILLAAVNWFSKTILSQPAWIIGIIVVIGYALLGKKWEASVVCVTRG
ncbi:hypothetical protein [Parafannyhessea umbonata]|nr:hypothetical protein [Parafannyhessea umbonata]MDD7198842.1 hypothetical protein [Parafannyhessea umbonata]MDY4418338.1 hypothetical protein [Parafannyhessea umbonata]